MFETYFGLKGKSDYFKDLDPVAPPMAGMLLATFVGALSAMWVGETALEQLSTTVTGNSFGNFINYGGWSIVGNMNGVLISSWMLLYFASAGALVAGPIYLTDLMSKFLDKNKGGNSDDGLRQLNYGVVVSIATYSAAWALVECAQLLINWFDGYNQAAYDAYLANTNSDLDHNAAMFWDLWNHTEITVSFIAAVMAIPGSSWYYVY